MSKNPSWPCLSARGDGALLRLAVVPNAKRTTVDGLHDGALRVRLAAPPIEGRANEALVAWLAKSMGVPRRAIELVHGASGRRKVVAIASPPETVAAWLASVLAAPR
jgi:uncharacterized protein (TIGR00251 family)